ncbi:winged helix-turn-helix transcriptional regulator [Deinococcus peraridilitoris]|nr:helix-turn-helix domain-containing protein [Deinococcus peraridilitoris]
MNDFDHALCPRYHRAVEIIGRRWNGAILLMMLRGATRFTELRGAIPDISDKMLSERLKELEHEGLIRRTVIPDTPVRVEYQLTDKGRALQAVVESISSWAEAWVDHAETVS